ncbi:hypothetical protein [Marivirga tractuosa]|uniref:Uncharacterized protein n=1 Tax=Marivirga tractuosa (strain ATCC 23168 / DSM 4126 / NBRC 15989 / NCIMB 1408 / VKM B-1430 / H-43) TaxID=643867 RepID=E4TVU0_MARTH|nr:hypothetical protein [Marivirga tractuosa]ADR22188.1 hypothetical protein Ftrac_2207 [Marivirga tractuosa DSM 4126]
MKYLITIRNIKKLTLCVFLLITYHVSYSQNSLDKAQGFWEEETEGFESYIVIENHYLYSITIFEGVMDISKELFGFYDDSEASRINPKNLSDSGKYAVFLIYRSSIKNYNDSIKRGYYNFYEYDLNDDYFIYYANVPVVLKKIETLPKNIQKDFETKKSELEDQFTFFEGKN